MKTNHLKFTITAMLLMSITMVFGQQPALQYFREESSAGLNVFETKKNNTVEFDGVKVRVGGDFTLQFQGMNQSNSGDSLLDLAHNFTLPSANLNLDVQLADGVRMHLRSYLSSKHHEEAYVKGGYLQMDKLDFIKPGFLSGVMNFTTIRVGMDELNYGDTHFRRSDNARGIYNPFVANYIMDAFTVQPFAEVNFQPSDFLVVIGATNGRTNQTPTHGDDGMSVYGKLGYDKQFTDDFRFRLTGSVYSTSKKSTVDYLYYGDRAGSRYFNVMDAVSTSDFGGRFTPGYAYLTSYQINPFLKYKGLEFFGVMEFINNGNKDTGGNFTQLGSELIYRFGSSDQLYIAGRYNQVGGQQTDGAAHKQINRVNVGGGWYLTPNVMAKIEYVKQTYIGNAWDGTKYEGAQFNGINIQATIGF